MKCLFCPKIELSYKGDPRSKHCEECKTRFYFNEAGALTSYHMNLMMEDEAGHWYTARFYTKEYMASRFVQNKKIVFILDGGSNKEKRENILTLEFYPNITPFNIKEKVKGLLVFL